MLFTLGFAVTKLILPIVLLASSLFTGLQHQELIGLFGPNYQVLYEQCRDQSSIQQEQITQLKVDLREAEVQLEDINTYRESLEKREDVLRNREENLKQRESGIDKREQSLEQKNFDFTQRVEEIAKKGGIAEQIIANNEILKNRIESLEKKLDEGRELARENLKNERIYFEEKIGEEREINSKLQQKIERDNNFILILEVVLLLIMVAAVTAIAWTYINWMSWRRGKIVSPQGQVIEIDRQREELNPQQSKTNLISGKVTRE